MATVERAIPVGGASLNFKIVGGTTEPTNPKENTIWVNTETAIGEWQFSAVEPTTRADGSALVVGDVWVKTSGTSNANFNALKKNGIMIALVNAYQWNGSSWTKKDALIYQNNSWIEGHVFLYNNGDQCSNITGNWTRHYYGSYSLGTVTFGDTDIKLIITGTQMAAIATGKKINLTDIKCIYLLCTKDSGNNNVRICVKPTHDSTTYVANLWCEQSGLHCLDVSSISGEYYISIELPGTASNQFTIKEVYLE